MASDILARESGPFCVIVRDASWEREPNAFHELLERHDTCDVSECICPDGQKYDADSGKFELLLCAWCGSYGSHRACKGLLWRGSNRVCSGCAAIIDRSEKKEREVSKKLNSTEEVQSRRQRHKLQKISSQELQCSTEAPTESAVLAVSLVDTQEHKGIFSHINTTADTNIGLHKVDTQSTCSKSQLFSKTLVVLLTKIDSKINVVNRRVNVNNLPLYLDKPNKIVECANHSNDHDHHLKRERKIYTPAVEDVDNHLCSSKEVTSNLCDPLPCLSYTEYCSLPLMNNERNPTTLANKICWEMMSENLAPTCSMSVEKETLTGGDKQCAHEEEMKEKFCARKQGSLCSISVNITLPSKLNSYNSTLHTKLETCNVAKSPHKMCASINQIEEKSQVKDEGKVTAKQKATNSKLNKVALLPVTMASSGHTSFGGGKINTILANDAREMVETSLKHSVKIGFVTNDLPQLHRGNKMYNCVEQIRGKQCMAKIAYSKRTLKNPINRWDKKSKLKISPASKWTQTKINFFFTKTPPTSQFKK